jgi:intracellular sulfur oxidation DsrE/DsrF family protein
VTNLESVIGQLGLDDLSFMNLLDDAKQLLDSGIQQVACTNCIKEAYTIARQDFPDQVSIINDQVIDVCGVEFIGMCMMTLPSSGPWI